MHDYLVCSNPRCRLVLDLQDCRKPIDTEKIGLPRCPECRSEWSLACPFCAQSITITWRGHQAHCGHCHRRFFAQAA